MHSGNSLISYESIEKIYRPTDLNLKKKKKNTFSPSLPLTVLPQSITCSINQSHSSTFNCVTFANPSQFSNNTNKWWSTKESQLIFLFTFKGKKQVTLNSEIKREKHVKMKGKWRKKLAKMSDNDKSKR